MAQVAEILSYIRLELIFYIANTIGVDVLATQGARASSTMILTMLNRNKSAQHVKGHLKSVYHVYRRFIVFMYYSLIKYWPKVYVMKYLRLIEKTQNAYFCIILIGTTGPRLLIALAGK